MKTTFDLSILRISLFYCQLALKFKLNLSYLVENNSPI